MSAPEYVSRPAPSAFAWLRSNLSITVFLFSLVSGACGLLVNGTLRIASFENRMTSAEHSDTDLANRVLSLENDRHERDERRIKLAADMGVVNQRLTGLEQQIKGLPPLQSTVQDIDQRGTAGLAVTRREIEIQIASVSQRLAVLESQIHWIGDRLEATGSKHGR